MAKKVDIFSLEDIPKIGPIGRSKLEGAGIFSKTDMLVFPWVLISEVTGMTKEEAESAVQYCRHALQEAGLQPKSQMTALELYEERLKLKRWTTGSEALDELIGGIEAKSITEFSGKFGSGKTQIGLTLAVTVCMEKPKDEKKPNSILYIDTEGTFRPERIIEIAKAKDPKCDEKKLLGQIIIMKPMDASHQIIILENAVHLMDEMNIKAIVVDSGTALFRQELSDYGNQGLKFRKLNKYVHLMSSIAEVYNIPIVVINQVYDSSDPFSPGQKIYGGNVWGHAMTYRVGLKKKGKAWVATTIDFPNRAVGDALFDITKAGITDIKKKEKKEKD